MADAPSVSSIEDAVDVLVVEVVVVVVVEVVVVVVDEGVVCLLIASCNEITLSAPGRWNN